MQVNSSKDRMKETRRVLRESRRSAAMKVFSPALVYALHTFLTLTSRRDFHISAKGIHCDLVVLQRNVLRGSGLSDRSEEICFPFDVPRYFLSLEQILPPL